MNCFVDFAVWGMKSLKKTRVDLLIAHSCGTVDIDYVLATLFLQLATFDPCYVKNYYAFHGYTMRHFVVFKIRLQSQLESEFLKAFFVRTLTL